MTSEYPDFFERLLLAFILPWKVLFDAAFAAHTRKLLTAGTSGSATTDALEATTHARETSARSDAGPETAAPESRASKPAIPESTSSETSIPETGASKAGETGASKAGETGASKAAGTDPTTAMVLLSILQREGRLLDFLQEDVTEYPDADIGAAARVVHEGCRRGLKDYLVLEPVRNEGEGDVVVLERGFDAARTRVTGNVVGEPPFRGHLAHHGWQVSEIRLPEIVEGHDPRVVAPAEVEL